MVLYTPSDQNGADLLNSILAKELRELSMSHSVSECSLHESAKRPAGIIHKFF